MNTISVEKCFGWTTQKCKSIFHIFGQYKTINKINCFQAELSFYGNTSTSSSILTDCLFLFFVRKYERRFSIWTFLTWCSVSAILSRNSIGTGSSWNFRFVAKKMTKIVLVFFCGYVTPNSLGIKNKLRVNVERNSLNNFFPWPNSN